MAGKGKHGSAAKGKQRWQIGNAKRVRTQQASHASKARKVSGRRAA